MIGQDLSALVRYVEMPGYPANANDFEPPELQDLVGEFLGVAV